MELIATFAFPEFAMLNVCDEDVPVVTLPKLKLVGLTESASVEVTPVPLSAIVVGEFAALLVSVSIPVTLVVLEGAN